MEVYVGSSATKAIASRLGLGRMRHLEVHFLCVQELANNKRIDLKKVETKVNVADLLTTPLPHAVTAALLELAGLRFVEPRRTPIDVTVVGMWGCKDADTIMPML